jgi:hypothetical protein
MRTVLEKIYARIHGDTTDKNGRCLQTLLGSIDRIYAGFNYQIPSAPALTFFAMSTIPNSLNGDNVMVEEEFVEFRVFADNHSDIAARLRQLMDRYTFAETSEAGVLRAVWQNDGPQLFDEDLKVHRRDSLFKIYVMPKAIGPV